MIRSIIGVWGGFSPSEVQNGVGTLGRLEARVGYLSVDVSIYDDLDVIVNYTMNYSELTDLVLEELLVVCRLYNEVMLEENDQE